MQSHGSSAKRQHPPPANAEVECPAGRAAEVQPRGFGASREGWCWGADSESWPNYEYQEVGSKEVLQCWNWHRSSEQKPVVPPDALHNRPVFRIAFLFIFAV